MTLFEKLKDAEERKKILSSAKEKMKKAVDKIAGFVIDHPAWIAFLAVAARKVIKNAVNSRIDRIAHQTVSFWDPSARMYFYTKRPLTETEKQVFMMYRRDGYTVYETLRRMGML